MAKSILADKSIDFAVRIVKFYKYLCDEKKNMSFQNRFFAQEQALVLIYARAKMHKAMLIL